jgi:hypothetical protein
VDAPVPYEHRGVWVDEFASINAQLAVGAVDDGILVLPCRSQRLGESKSSAINIVATELGGFIGAFRKLVIVRPLITCLIKAPSIFSYERPIVSWELPEPFEHSLSCTTFHPWLNASIFAFAPGKACRADATVCIPTIATFWDYISRVAWDYISRNVSALARSKHPKNCHGGKDRARVHRGP